MIKDNSVNPFIGVHVAAVFVEVCKHLNIDMIFAFSRRLFCKQYVEKCKVETERARGMSGNEAAAVSSTSECGMRCHATNFLKICTCPLKR